MIMETGFQALRNGEDWTTEIQNTVFEPHYPRNSQVTFSPVDPDKIKPGDMVVAKIHQTYKFGMIRRVDKSPDTQQKNVQLADATGHVLGWTYASNVAGAVASS